MRPDPRSSFRVDVLPPNNRFLSRFVRNFYFIRGWPGREWSYVTFPQLTTPVCLIKNMRLQFSKDGRQIHSYYDQSATPQAKVFGPFSQSVLVSLSREVNEVAIVFHPLGLNQFIRRPYAAEINSSEQVFEGFGDSLDSFLPELFSLETNEERRQAVESFLLRRYVGFENQKLEQALSLLTDTGNHRLIDISRQVGLSTKSLDRSCLTHLGATPRHIRKIARFRRSAELITAAGPAMRLIDIAHASQYYDQADFIKQYHKLAGVPPGEFFKHTSNIDGAGMLWQMLQPLRRCPKNTIHTGSQQI